MIASLRQRYTLFLATSLIFVFCVAFYLRSNITPSAVNVPVDEKPARVGPIYKPEKPSSNVHIIVDNFPLAAAAHSASELPSIASWNAPPSPHVPENTPLFIGFTRNWRLLQQVIVSYITAGWPPEDIIVVENTGVMDSNKNGKLSIQNPFFLNHTRLRMLGVNIHTLPTLFSFAQLQNYFIYTSIQNGWKQYFWGHMDIAVVSFEATRNESDWTTLPLYTNCVNFLRAAEATADTKPWAMRFHHYDHLALVNVAAFVQVGGWDTFIPYYKTDCDMHQRLAMAKLDIQVADVANIYDVASTLDDLLVFYRKEGVEPQWQNPNDVDDEKWRARLEEEQAQKEAEAAKAAKDGRDVKSLTRGADLQSDTLASPLYTKLTTTLKEMEKSKVAAVHRNSWQDRQIGGKGEPFYRDPEGFMNALEMQVAVGFQVYDEKWGHKDCELVRAGLKLEDAWKVEHDWED